MCGIIGYTGNKPALKYLINGLGKLEYRGYDSTGVAVVSETGEIKVRKSKGRLSELEKKLENNNDLSGVVGIGHTRWATHGEPNDVNAHPHVGQNEKIAIVHNGIIENYLELKTFLISEGISFKSETDTEVVAQLIEYYYMKNGDVISSVYEVMGKLKGSYAIGVLCSDSPEQMVALRKDAPLLIGYGDGCNFISSDVTALLAHTRTVTYMEDNEIAVINASEIKFFDLDRNQIEKEKSVVEWDVESAEKCGYEHFMLKEIMEQPECVRKTVSPRLLNGEIYFNELANNADLIKNVNKIYIVACGSAYHVGMIGKYTLEKLLKIPVEPCYASEFRYREPLIDENTLTIVISQSGETLDTMAALREAKSKGSKTLALVNVIGSSIARESDIVIYTWAGPEIAVATTKAYSAQVTLLTMLGVYFSKQLGQISSDDYKSFIDGLNKLPEQMQSILDNAEEYKNLALNHSNHKSVFYIGRNVDYALGLEGSLKLKEISYINSESYAAGELKHGTISLMEPGVLVFALATYLPLFEKTYSNILEVKARGADIIMLTLDGEKEKASEQINELVSVPRTHPLLQSNLAIIPLQIFAYYVAKNRGCDIDKPRNLAKSVTVE